MLKIRKQVSFLLIIALVVYVFSPQILTVSAAPLDDRQAFSEQDYFAQELTEVVEVEGVEYTAHYSYNEFNDRIITITNEMNGDVDVLLFDDTNSSVYLNGEIAATWGSDFSASDDTTTYGPGWENVGGGKEYITWGKAVTVAVFAYIVAGVLSLMTGSMVILAMGIGTISLIASMSIGGTIRWTMYKYETIIAINVLYEWRFIINNEYYGPYEHMLAL